MFYWTKPWLCNMHQFGTVCYACVQNKSKLDARSETSICVWYDKCSTAYLVYFPENNTVKRIWCVHFKRNFDDRNDMSEMYDYVPSNPVCEVPSNEPEIDGNFEGVQEVNWCVY